MTNSQQTIPTKKMDFILLFHRKTDQSHYELFVSDMSGSGPV